LVPVVAAVKLLATLAAILSLTPLRLLAAAAGMILVMEHQAVLVAAVAITVMAGALRKETQAARRDTVTLVAAATITDLIGTQEGAAAVLGRLVHPGLLPSPVMVATADSTQSQALTHTTLAVEQAKEKSRLLTATALPV
jgi:hypothetical protein